MDKQTKDSTMIEEKKSANIPVNIRHLEQAFGVDLHKFEPGETYLLSKLMDALGFMKPGRPKAIRGENKN